MTRETATYYLTRKVAQIIYDTVECSAKPRAETDWLAAERIVSTRFGWMIGRMIGEPLACDEWGHWNMSDAADAATFGEFDRVLGAAVWANTQCERRHLPSPPYGQITFS